MMLRRLCLWCEPQSPTTRGISQAHMQEAYPSCPDGADCDVVIGIIVNQRQHPYNLYISLADLGNAVVAAMDSSSFQVW